MAGWLGVNGVDDNAIRVTQAVVGRSVATGRGINSIDTAVKRSVHEASAWPASFDDEESPWNESVLSKVATGRDTCCCFAWKTFFFLCAFAPDV